MSTGSSQPVVQQQTTSEPWSGAQSALGLAMGSAQNLYSANEGYMPWQGQTQASLDPRMDLGLANMVNLAATEPYGSAGVNAALGQATNMQNSQGLSGAQTGYVVPQMQRLGQNYDAIYNEASGQQNPYLLAQIAANDRRIADKVNSSMSGAGRYGSGAHTDVLSRSLAEAANPILAQDYTQRQATRLAASQGAGGIQRDINDIYSGGLNRMGQFAQMIPAFDQARYAGSDRLMAAGQYGMDREQQNLNSVIQQYNAFQARPWEQVARLNAIAAGGGQLGGTKITTAPPTTPPLSSRILGGGIAGGTLGNSIFPGGLGAGLGALGGAGLGAFGFG